MNCETTNSTKECLRFALELIGMLSISQHTQRTVVTISQNNFFLGISIRNKIVSYRIFWKSLKTREYPSRLEFSEKQKIDNRKYHLISNFLEKPIHEKASSNLQLLEKKSSVFLEKSQNEKVSSRLEFLEKTKRDRKESIVFSPIFRGNKKLETEQGPGFYFIFNCLPTWTGEHPVYLREHPLYLRENSVCIREHSVYSYVNRWTLCILSIHLFTWIQSNYELFASHISPWYWHVYIPCYSYILPIPTSTFTIHIYIYTIPSSIKVILKGDGIPNLPCEKKKTHL